jgi:chitinase
MSNQAPIANAGPDQSVAANALVTLDGSASTDADGTVQTYLWSQLSGTTVTLSSTSVVRPTFTSPAPINGATLVFQLSVLDNQGLVSGSPDTVTITVAKRAQVNVRINGVWVAKPLKGRKSGAWAS